MNLIGGLECVFLVNINLMSRKICMNFDHKIWGVSPIFAEGREICPSPASQSPATARKTELLPAPLAPAMSSPFPGGVKCGV